MTTNPIPTELGYAVGLSEHQRARRAAKRGFLLLAMVYFGVLAGSLGMAMDQMAHPFGG